MKIWRKRRQLISFKDKVTKYYILSPQLPISDTYLFLIVLGFSLWLFLTNVTVFLDDVFIYLRVAKNISNGYGPVLNPSDSHFPVTSPLWVFLLAGLHKLFGFIDLIIVAKIVFTVMLAFAAYLGYVCVHYYVGRWAILIPLPIFFNFITVTTVGGEIALVYLSLFGILWAYYVKRNYLITGIWAAVAYLSRGEAVLMLIPIALHILFFSKQNEKSVLPKAFNIGKIVVVFLLIAAIWHIYYAIEFQTLFPNTLKTKIVQGKSGMWPLYYQKGRVHAMEILGKKYYMMFFLVFGILYLRALSFSLVCFSILHYYGYKFLSIAYYHWYFYDYYLFIPMFTMFGIIVFFISISKLLEGYGNNLNLTSRHAILSKTAIAVIVSICIFTCIMNTTKISTISNYNDSKDDRFIKYSKAVHWIKNRHNKGDVLLAPEIGIIGYFLRDCDIRDVNGIASPDVTIENINKIEYFVELYEPRFIFFPPCEPHTNNIEYIAINNEVFVYKKGFEEIENGENRESVFCYIGRKPSPAHCEILKQLILNATRPGIQLKQYENQIVLSIPLTNEFQSDLNVPVGSTRVFLHLGLIPETFKNEKSGCKVVCRLEGIKKKEKILLWREVLTPSNEQMEEQATIDLHPETSNFDHLQITIKKKPYFGMFKTLSEHTVSQVALYTLLFQKSSQNNSQE